MAETIEQKCEECKEKFIIERNNISGVVLCKSKYYHEKCFCQMCERKAAKKSSLPFWQEALDNIEQYKNDAVEMSNYWFAQNELNEWILTHYDVMEIPRWFWTNVGYLRNGKYNNKKCKPVSTDLLVRAWKWAQKNLDSINRRNKQNKKGPQTDADRLNYDLAIVLHHIPDYLKAKAKHDAEEAERQVKAKENINIDYSKVQAKKESTGLGDISDLIDDLI